MVKIVLALIKGVRVLVSLALHPALPASALLFLVLRPAQATAITRSWPIGTHKLRYVLSTMLGLGLGSRINGFLNRWATNNWSTQPQDGWQWDREIAVVTGGCSGIGKSMVLGLAQKGIRVAILDVQNLPDDLSEIPVVSYWKCDITSSASIHEAADGIREQLGNPSILINNAGIANMGSIIDIPEEKLRKLLDVNLISHWSTVKEFLPSMIAQNKGHIVTVASMASFLVVPTAVDYSTSKAGALAFHEGLTAEIKHVYKAPGVVTSVAHPTWVSTPMTAPASDAIEKHHGKMMTPDHVAGRILSQIFSRRGGQLIIPDQLSWVSGIRGFPNWMQEVIRDGTGIRG